MYVFTWPLPNQCPFQEISHFYDSSSINLSSGGMNKGSTAKTNIEVENFDNNSNSKLKKYYNVENEETFDYLIPSIDKCSILKCNKTIEENDEEFEQPADIVRQIPIHV